MKTLAAVIALCAIAFIGCGTTKGAGKDLENPGTDVQSGFDAGASNATTDNQADNETGMGAGMGENPDENAINGGTGNNPSDISGY